MTPKADDGFPLPDLFGMEEWRTIGWELGLTGRQVEVARLICRGLQRKQIAHTLAVSEAAVRTHMEGLFRRLDIRDRVGVPIRFVLAHRQLRPGRGRRPDSDKRPN